MGEVKEDISKVIRILNLLNSDIRLLDKIEGRKTDAKNSTKHLICASKVFD